MNYSVKDDNPDIGVSVTVGEVKDAEGNVIPDAQVTVALASSDENVVGIVFDAVAKTGTVHFGSPGNASVATTVTDANGTILASGGDNFTVTTGDPASVASVATTFDGLTPIPDAPVV